MTSIYLSVEPQAISLVRDTLDSLIENSTSAQSIVVIDTALNEAKIRRIVGDAAPSAITVEFIITEVPDHLSLALNMAAKSGDMTGTLFVKSGVTVPYAWDARLERIAQHNPKIGTVSPLCDSFAIFALLGDEERAKIAPTDTQYVDSLTFSLSSRTYIEVPCFLEDCFYISPGALKSVTTKVSKVYSADPNIYWNLARMLSAQGYLNVLGDCLYVYSMRKADTAKTRYLLEQDAVQSIIRANPFKRLRSEVPQLFANKISFKSLPGLDYRPVQLHVLHGMGGGVDKWVRDYCSADNLRVNLILKSFGRSGAFKGLMLFSDVNDIVPLQTWEFAIPIQATAVSHLDYAGVVDEIIRRHSVDVILVSSFIGHSLDILNTSKKTILISHDYYPYCPALNITFDSLCTNCDFPRLEQCFKQNIHNRHFRDAGANDWAALREEYLARVRAKDLKMVIPNPSVKDNLIKLEPRFSDVEFVLISHGTTPMQAMAASVTAIQASDTKLRLLIPGRITPDKGMGILKEISSELTSIADVYLVGCGQEGAFFEYKNMNKIIYSYKLDELPRIIYDINPDIALLLSVVPETFSYTLSELTELRVPVIATNLGSFADRVEDDKTGFLVEPKAKNIIDKINALDADRTRIKMVKANLENISSKSVAEMVADYQNLLPIENLKISRFHINIFTKTLNINLPEQRQHELLRKENELSQILSSRSWWLTKPLRLASKLFKAKVNEETR